MQTSFPQKSSPLFSYQNKFLDIALVWLIGSDNILKW